MSTRALSFYLILIVLGVVYGLVVIATEPRFECDGFGVCTEE